VRNKIFISYRRQDSAANALGIGQYLENQLGRQNIFIDVDMRAGTKFPAVLEARLAECKVMLVLIGLEWLDARDDHGNRRLDDPADWVRLEVAHALRRGITVIPVRVNGAELPKKMMLPDDIRGLLDHQAVSVTTTSFRNDMAGLVRDVRSIQSLPNWGRVAGSSVGLLMLLLTIWAGFHLIGEPVWTLRISRVLESIERLFEKAPHDTKENNASQNLRRSEFNEWTMYGTSNTRFAMFIKLSSVKQFGDRVASLMNTPGDPSAEFEPGKKYSEGDYDVDVVVVDCKKPLLAFSEKTVYNKHGERLSYYKWGDPELLDFSIGITIDVGTVAEALQNILCHEELSTPLVAKTDLASMKFKSLASTNNGDGELFYGSIGVDSPNEMILIAQYHADRSIADDLFPHQPIVSLPASYRTLVQRVLFACAPDTFKVTKEEYYDASSNLVYLKTLMRSAPPAIIIPASPIGMLRRVACTSNKAQQ
jgi:hypothetical protein